MNIFEKFWLSEISKKVILNLKQIEEWEVNSYTIEHKSLKNLKLWICNGWQFLDIITPGSTTNGSGWIPFKDRYILWKYVKPILNRDKDNMINMVFTSTEEK